MPIKQIWDDTVKLNLYYKKPCHSWQGVVDAREPDRLLRLRLAYLLAFAAAQAQLPENSPPDCFLYGICPSGIRAFGLAIIKNKTLPWLAGCGGR